MNSPKISKADWHAVILFYHVLGLFGAHRFFLGRWITGILWLLTLGCGGIGALIDGILLYSGNFKDAEGALVVPPSKLLMMRALEEIKISADKNNGFSVYEPGSFGSSEFVPPEPEPNISVTSSKSVPDFVSSHAHSEKTADDGRVSLVKIKASDPAVLTLRNYVSLDTETTGLNAEHDRIVEISLLKIENREIVGEYSTLVNPGIPIPERATKIHGISDADVFGAPSYDQVGNEIVQFLGNCTIVGHNVRFDLGFMAALLKNTILENDLTWKYVDTVDVAKIAFPNETNYKLQTLVKDLGIETDDAHRARADALATKLLFEKCSAGLLSANEMLCKSVDIALNSGSVSTSSLQKSLGIGYTKAARLVDQMEEMGLIGPFNGSKPRAVLITHEEWAARKGK